MFISWIQLRQVVLYSFKKQLFIKIHLKLLCQIRRVSFVSHTLTITLVITRTLKKVLKLVSKNIAFSDRLISIFKNMIGLKCRNPDECY